MSSIIAATAAVVAAISVAACYEQAPQIVQAPVAAAPVIAQPAPVVVQQSHDGFFTGMLMGHLMSGGGGASRNTTVINKSYTNVTRVAPSRSYSYSRSSSFSSSRSFGGRR
ncbi:hypothetical protein [Burkholderia cenocepacia]|uniref:hypothetical protein n=1 Tax=Burkholderia cenocepacia TaxID=95486 RepID=UPI0024B67761|nr:hypothetical protein [Burkholderia cenocepacia]MDI9686589.1 hypothetical protein [Burkholderia cenocepacia]